MGSKWILLYNPSPPPSHVDCVYLSEYEETLDALQKELRNAEGENSELKERAKNMSKKALLQVLQINDKNRRDMV